MAERGVGGLVLAFDAWVSSLVEVGEVFAEGKSQVGVAVMIGLVVVQKGFFVFSARGVVGYVLPAVVFVEGALLLCPALDVLEDFLQLTLADVFIAEDCPPEFEDALDGIFFGVFVAVALDAFVHDEVQVLVSWSQFPMRKRIRRWWCSLWWCMREGRKEPHLFSM